MKLSRKFPAKYGPVAIQLQSGQCAGTAGTQYPLEADRQHNAPEQWPRRGYAPHQTVICRGI